MGFGDNMQEKGNEGRHLVRQNPQRSNEVDSNRSLATKSHSFITAAGQVCRRPSNGVALQIGWHGRTGAAVKGEKSETPQTLLRRTCIMNPMNL